MESISTKTYYVDEENQVTIAADMTGITNNGNPWVEPFHFDGNPPQGLVAKPGLFIEGKTAVNGSQALDSHLVQAFQGADPKIEIGVHGIFNQHGDIHACQCIGQGLDGEGVGGGSGADPNDIDTVFEAEFDVFGDGHFGGDH